MIGGNLQAVIQVSTGSTMNIIGESVPSWKDAQTIRGWLDLSSGEARYSTFNAKIQESTHVFMADYVPLHKDITAENSRMVIQGKVYDILLIDNPMELNQHFEIFLKYTGG